MAPFNTNLLLELIDASEALSAEKKAAVKAKLPSFNETQKTQLYDLLLAEQKHNAEYYRKKGELKIKSTEKKIKIIYNHAEKALNKEEEKDIEALENQLANLDA